MSKLEAIIVSLTMQCRFFSLTQPPGGAEQSLGVHRQSPFIAGPASTSRPARTPCPAHVFTLNLASFPWKVVLKVSCRRLSRGFHFP